MKMFIVIWVVNVYSLVGSYQHFRGIWITAHKTTGVTMQKTTGEEMKYLLIP
jgi:hypothetical protein